MRALLLLPLLMVLAACQTTGGGSAGGGSAGGAGQGSLLAAKPSAPDPALLPGQDAVGLSALLGEPTLVRREAEVEIWQYQAEGCVLDVFFYPDGSTRRVLHLEARDRVAAGDHPLDGCLDQVVIARAKQQAT